MHPEFSPGMQSNSQSRVRAPDLGFQPVSSCGEQQHIPWVLPCPAGWAGGEALQMARKLQEQASGFCLVFLQIDIAPFAETSLDACYPKSVPVVASHHYPSISSLCRIQPQVSPC